MQVVEPSQVLFSLETLVITVSAGAVAALVVGFVTGYCCGRRCGKDAGGKLDFKLLHEIYLEELATLVQCGH